MIAVVWLVVGVILVGVSVYAAGVDAGHRDCGRTGGRP